VADLRTAVQARLDAHLPSIAPPFDTITALGRRRGRRRRAAGAVAAVAVLAAGAATVPQLGTPDGGSVTADGTGEATAVVFRTDFASAPMSGPAAAALRACENLPGVRGSVLLPTAPARHELVFRGTADERDAVRACLGALPGARVTAAAGAASCPAQPGADLPPAIVEMTNVKGGPAPVTVAAVAGQRVTVTLPGGQEFGNAPYVTGGGVLDPPPLKPSETSRAASLTYVAVAAGTARLSLGQDLQPFEAAVRVRC
jgi:hypothetical protein